MEKYEFVKIEYTTTFTTEDCNFEHNFSEGLCPVQIKRNEKWIFVNEKGEMAFVIIHSL